MPSKDNANPQQGPIPVFETVPDETVPPAQTVGSAPAVIPEVLPDETEETPESLTVSDIGGNSGIYDGPPPIDDSAFDSNNKSRFIFIAVGIGIFLLVFFGILSFLLSLRGKNQPVVLEYWGLWESEKIYQGVIADYHRLNPSVTIKYIKKDPKSYREKLVTQGKEGRGPDIFRFHNTWLPSIAEIAAPIPKNIMTNDEFEKTFYKVAQEDLKIDTSYHGLPLEIDGLILVYNNNLFKKAGILSSPKTWEDLVKASNPLRVQDTSNNILTSGIALGTSNNIEHFSDIMGWMFIQNGADIRQLNAPEAVQVLIDYRRFAEPPLNFWSEKMPNNISAFVQEKVAMIIVPSWQIIEIKQSNPDIDIKTASLPVLPGGQPISIASYWVEGVSRTSKNQEEAWKFLKYLTTKEIMEKLYKTEAETRLFGEPYSRVDLQQKLIQNEYIGPVLEQAPFMKSLPVISRTYDNGLNDQIISYLNDAVEATIQGVSYEEAMGKASQGVKQVLEQFNIK